MKEEQFLKTMLYTLRYDDYENKERMMKILRYSIITYDKTDDWTRKSWQKYEYIDIRVPIPMIKEARELKRYFHKLAEEIYIEKPDYDMAGIHIKPKPVELEEEEESDHDVVFEEIKDTIIQGIRNAKYTVWIAVAWFTDRDILKELLIKKKQGVNIRIITSYEKSNNHIIDELESNFETVKISMKGRYLSNRMHDKFCIVDLEYVMHGSYNWSRNAGYNDETLATALDKEFVRKFADEFMKLYNEHKKTSSESL